MFVPLTPNIWLSILSSPCHSFPYKLKLQEFGVGSRQQILLDKLKYLHHLFTD